MHSLIVIGWQSIEKNDTDTKSWVIVLANSHHMVTGAFECSLKNEFGRRILMHKLEKP